VQQLSEKCKIGEEFPVLCFKQKENQKKKNQSNLWNIGAHFSGISSLAGCGISGKCQIGSLKKKWGDN
jgi:hypothetical protein